MNNSSCKVSLLGQSGCRIEVNGVVIFVDPYLSNSVQELDSGDLERLKPPPIKPEHITNADWVLLTHDHIDHCDPHTVPSIAKFSPNAKFAGTYSVVEKLVGWGIDQSRIHLVQEKWLTLNDQLDVIAVPAAHLDVVRNSSGDLQCVGYVIKIGSEKIYFAGDTRVTDEVIHALTLLLPIHTAFLPVNEHNFFRNKRGIVGNMSVREAFGLAELLNIKQVIPVHWDMFAVNSVSLNEIYAIYQQMQPNFVLNITPFELRFAKVRVSVIIRTLNEAKYLGELLAKIQQQQSDNVYPEVIVVDSGSTDQTLEIATMFGCRVIHIKRDEFSFGRALNIGCQVARGDIFVITSGHCVPVDDYWLDRLCKPILDGQVGYVYGRQFGGNESYFSECRIFDKYFPSDSKVPQQGFFCNNANSAIAKDVWQTYAFDEQVTGLEDMFLAQKFVNDGGKVGYVADAGVYHFHQENWAQVQRRFEREAIALQQIMPQIHVSFFDMIRYFTTSVIKDFFASLKDPMGKSSLKDIILYRFNQYIGSYRGNHTVRVLSKKEKEHYFYPD